MNNPEKTKGAMKNEQSRETGNIGYTRHRTKTNKYKKHNAENWKDEQHGPHQNLIHVFIGSTFGTNLPPEYN